MQSDLKLTSIFMNMWVPHRSVAPTQVDTSNVGARAAASLPRECVAISIVRDGTVVARVTETPVPARKKRRGSSSGDARSNPAIIALPDAKR
jgi:hypothetical protein